MISIPKLWKMYANGQLHGLPSGMDLQLWQTAQHVIIVTHGPSSMEPLAPRIRPTQLDISMELATQWRQVRVLPTLHARESTDATGTGSQAVQKRSAQFSQDRKRYQFQHVLRCSNTTYIFHISENNSKMRCTFFTTFEKNVTKFKRGMPNYLYYEIARFIFLL